jgi:hypothetical protein
VATQKEWDAAQLEYDVEIIMVSALYPGEEWIPSPQHKGWVRRQDPVSPEKFSGTQPKPE